MLGLRKSRALSSHRALIRIDFQVISGYIEKKYQVREPRLAKYLHSVQKMESYFLRVTTTRNIPRADNSDADKLAKAIAKGRLSLPLDMF